MSRSNRFLAVSSSTKDSRSAMELPLRRSLRAIAALTLAASVAAPMSADFRSSFKKGIQAAEQERWEEVAKAMKEALQDRPAAQKTRVPIYGSKTVVYIPNTMLGIALSNLDRCAEAWSYFQAAEAQGIAQTHDKERFGNMLREKSACKDALVRQNLAEANPLLQDAQGIREAIDAILKQPGARSIFDGRSNFSIGFENGKEALIGAEQRVQMGVSNGNFEAIAESVNFARVAIAELSTVRRDLNVAIKSGIAGELGAAQTAVRGAEEEAQRTARKKQDAGSDWTREFQSAESQALTSLNQAKAELAAGRSANDRNKLVNVVRLASAAKDGFKKLNDRRIQTAPPTTPGKAPLEGPTRAQLRAADRALVEASSAREDLESTRSMWSGIAEVTSKADGLGRELDQVRRKMEQAKSAKDSQSLVAATRSAERLVARFRDTESESRRLAQTDTPTTNAETPDPTGGPTNGAVPTQLTNAARSYFEGEYEAALDQLKSASFEGMAQSQVFLLRAAANFALYQISGQAADEYKTAASEALSELKQSGQSATPLARFFPPPFVEFVANSGD